MSATINRLGLAFAAFIVAALATAVTQLIQPSFIESTVGHAALDALFIGVTVYFCLKILERIVDSQ